MHQADELAQLVECLNADTSVLGRRPIPGSSPGGGIRCLRIGNDCPIGASVANLIKCWWESAIQDTSEALKLSLEDSNPL